MPVDAPLVGRDPELALLRATLEATSRGAGGCLVMVGQPGIGKSRLLEEAIRIAGELDLTIAAGRATELDRVAPARTLMSALRGLSEVVPALRPPPAGEPGAPTLRYIDDLVDALDAYVARRPLLIVIDDLQWADELSALALRILVTSLAGSPVRWLLARRPVPAHTAGQETAAWLLGEGGSELELRPLDEPAVQTLCSHVLGAQADASVLALTGRGRGNPFLIEQLLTAMTVSGQILVSEGTATVVGSELPSSFVAAVDQRLRGLSAEARRLLAVGSVFGRAFDLHEAARLADVAAGSLTAPAGEALASGLLVAVDDRLDFAHDLLRQAVYDHLPRPVRSTMHREAAAALRSAGRPAVEIAEHLIRAGGTGDREAAQILRVAARDVAARAPAAAADLIARAVSMVDELDPVRSELGADAVSLLASAGRLVEARAAGEIALRGDLDGPAEAQALLGLAEAHKHAGQNATTVEYARRGLARPGITDAARARLQAIAAHAMLWTDIDGAETAGADAERLGASSGEAGAAVFGAAARVVVALAGGRVADAVAHAERAVAMADRAGGEAVHRHPRIWLGAALVAADRLGEAREVFATGRLEAERLGTAWSLPLWHNHDAEALVALGRLDAAAGEAEAGLRIAGQLTARQMAMPLLSVLATIAVYRGDTAAAHNRLRQMHELVAAGVTGAPEDLAWPTAAVHEADRRFDLAAEALASLYDALPERLLLLTMNPGTAPVLVRVALGARDRPRADRVAAAIRALAAGNPGIAAMAAAADHAEGIRADDLDALRSAVRRYEGSDRRLDRARAREDCGEAEGRHGAKPRGVELLTLALDEYRECAALAAAQRTERRLRTLGVRRGRPPRPDGDGPLGRLTEAELLVVNKVAEGCTNRETAEALCISRHTVDSHLRSAFAKLGINSRVELTRLVLTDPHR